MKRALVTAALLSALATLSGCVVAVGNRDYSASSADQRRTVSRSVFDQVVHDNKDVHLGMTRQEALGHYPDHLLTKFNAAEFDGRVLEVWQVYALNSSRNARFERWLYFVDDRLVEMARQEINYDADPAILDRWLAH